MKNPLAKQFSKHARHIAKRYVADEAQDIIRALANLRNLTAQIRMEVAPVIGAMRDADDYQTNGYKSLLPNNPETYGLSTGQLQAKYHNPLACHSGKNDCDVEMDEQSAAIVGATIHTGDEQKPL